MTARCEEALATYYLEISEKVSTAIGFSVDHRLSVARRTLKNAGVVP
jgi:hypothetical protein